MYVSNTPYRLDLFKDEKISLTSTIQQINDIGKVFTDYTQTFTIPATPYNNSVFNHWYESFVDNGYDHRVRSNGYITIDGELFREGKIQIEKGAIKNNVIENYSVTFYGNLTQLKDRFKDDLLSVIDFSSFNHTYTATEVINRVTSTASYDVMYPLIGSNRRFTYKTGDAATDVTLDSGAIVWNQLFPAIKVKDVINKIGQHYGVTFSGTFLNYEQYKNLWFYLKPKDIVDSFTPELLVNISATNEASPAQVFSVANDTLTTTNNFFPASLGPLASGAYYMIQIRVTPSTSNKYRLIVYKNGSVFNIYDDLQGEFSTLMPQVKIIDEPNKSVYQFKISSAGPLSFITRIWYHTSYRYSYINDFGMTVWQNVNEQVVANINVTTAQTTQGLININNYIPNIKVSDFFMGIVKMFNMVIVPTTPVTFELIPLELYYSQGKILDISEYVSTSEINVTRPKLFKKISFLYENSDNILNDKFNKLFSPSRGYNYGDMIYEDINSNENQNYEIKLPFEDIMWERSQSTPTGTASPILYNFMTATLLDSKLPTPSPYVPKPVLMYFNGSATFSGTGNLLKISNSSTISTYSRYNRFSNEYNLSGADLSELYTINWGSEISPWYLTTAQRGLFDRHYKQYIKNLYSLKTRIVNVDTILPTRLINEIKLNNRLIIGNKRYVINQMTTDLTSNAVKFELITDYRELISNGPGFGTGYKLTSFDNIRTDYNQLSTQLVIYLNDFDSFDIGTPSNPFLIYATSSNNTQDVVLDVNILQNTGAPCNLYDINNGNGTITVNYVDCDGASASEYVFDAFDTVSICSNTVPVIATATGFGYSIIDTGVVCSYATASDRFSVIPVTYRKGDEVNTTYVSVEQLSNVLLTIPNNNPPTAPTSSTYTTYITSIGLTFSGATDDYGISGYEISYALEPFEFDPNPPVWNNVVISTTQSNNVYYLITGLLPASNYFIRVRTKDSNNAYSGYYNVNNGDVIMTEQPYTYYVSNTYVNDADVASCAIGTDYTYVFSDKLIGSIGNNDTIYTDNNFSSVYSGGSRYRAIQNAIVSPTYRKNIKISNVGKVIGAQVDCLPYSTQMINILNYATSQGWTLPNDTLISKIDNYIRRLINYNLWSRFDVFYQFAYNNTALKDFSRINWINPGQNTITFNGTASYGIDGFNGTYDGSYTGLKLDTNYSPSTVGNKYTLSSASAFAFGKFSNDGFSKQLFSSNTQLSLGEGNTGDMTQINFSSRTLYVGTDPNSVDLVLNRISTFNNDTPTSFGVPRPFEISINTNSTSNYNLYVFRDGSLVETYSDLYGNATEVYYGTYGHYYTFYIQGQGVFSTNITYSVYQSNVSLPPTLIYKIMASSYNRPIGINGLITSLNSNQLINTFTFGTASSYYLLDRLSDSQYEVYNNTQDLYGHQTDIVNNLATSNIKLLSSYGGTGSTASTNVISTFGAGQSLENDTNNSNLYAAMLGFRTSINVTQCLQYDIVNGPDTPDFINIQFRDCDGNLDGVSLYTPGASVLICSSTVPQIISFNGAYTIVPTGLTC